MKLNYQYEQIKVFYTHEKIHLVALELTIRGRLNTCFRF